MWTSFQHCTVGRLTAAGTARRQRQHSDAARFRGRLPAESALGADVGLAALPNTGRTGAMSSR